jgi:vacuolar protein sorting-associated protein 13A/C
VFFGTILNALGVVITNIEDAPIRLDGIVINDCIDSLQGINTKLITHYKGSVMKQLYKIFGSLNIIGNPVSLFRNISTGIKDMK